MRDGEEKVGLRRERLGGGIVDVKGGFDWGSGNRVDLGEYFGGLREGGVVFPFDSGSSESGGGT